jgi:hypothetical protein
MRRAFFFSPPGGLPRIMFFDQQHRRAVFTKLEYLILNQFETAGLPMNTYVAMVFCLFLFLPPGLA